MQDEKLSKLAFKYKPMGNRNRGRPKKQVERSILGSGVKNTGLMNLINKSSRRTAGICAWQKYHTSWLAVQETVQVIQ
jgi:hypothetical protein